MQALHGLVARLNGRVDALETARSAPPELPPIPAEPRVSPSRPDVEARFGSTVMNRVGALTLAIGVIFFFKYAVDLSWIGPFGHVAFGVLIGFLLLAASAWLNRRELGPFAQGIAGCGLAVLYISVYAAFFFYKLIPQPAAFAALLGVCACAVGLSLRRRAAAIAALGFLGGLLTPLLLHASGTETLLDLSYLLLIDLTCLVIAMRQRWQLLIPWMGASAVASAWILVDARHPGWFAWFALAMAVSHIGAAVRKERDGSLHEALYFTGHGCFALFFLSALDFWTQHAVAAGDRSSVLSALGSFLLGVYGVAALIYGVTRKSATDRTLGLVLLGLVIAKLYIWDVWFLMRLYRMMAFMALGILLLGASYAYSRWRSRSE